MWHGINVWSTIGLITDIIGVYLLFLYGLPSKIKEDGGKRLLEESEKAKTEREKWNRRIEIGSYTGLALIITGFVLQLIGNNLAFFE